MKITEEYFKKKLFEDLEFELNGYTIEEFLTEPLNGEKMFYGIRDFDEFLYFFLRSHDLPIEIYCIFPWTKYFKEGTLYCLKHRIRKWRGKEYDRDFFEPREPFYYDTLKNHLFEYLEYIENIRIGKIELTEETFRERFLKILEMERYTDREFSETLLNKEKSRYGRREFELFFNIFLIEHSLPMEICKNFPWTKYFKEEGIIYCLKHRIRKWWGKEYDRDFFAPKEPFTYDILEDYLFDSLKNKGIEP